MNVRGGIALIDTSYVVFAKWYSALGWYKMSINRHPDISVIMHSAVFREKLAVMFEQNVCNVLSEFGMSDAYLVFAKDCSRRSVWRRDHYISYKEGRAHSGSFNSDAFAFFYDVVIPSILERRRGCIIGVDGAEADDVIGVMSMYVRRFSPSERILIVTNDNDCIQLVDENTKAINLMSQDVGARRGDLTPEQYLRSRIISGDRSDNIPSILPRFGMKAAARIVQENDEESLRRMYEGTYYDRNELLMNLRNTPEHISCAIIDMYRGHVAGNASSAKA